MPDNLKKLSSYALIYVGLAFVLFGFVLLISNINTNFTQSIVYLLVVAAGLFMIAYVFSKE